jgi:hypothetical protein
VSRPAPTRPADSYSRPSSIAIEAIASHASRANIPKKATDARETTPNTAPSRPSYAGTTAARELGIGSLAALDQIERV